MSPEQFMSVVWDWPFEFPEVISAYNYYEKGYTDAPDSLPEDPYHWDYWLGHGIDPLAWDELAAGIKLFNRNFWSLLYK